VGLALAVDGVDIPGARTERDKGLVRSHPGHAACSRKQTACFSTFPYVCPEPVLANMFGFDYRVGRWFLRKKGKPFALPVETERMLRLLSPCGWGGAGAPPPPAWQGVEGSESEETRSLFLSAFPMFVPSLSW
jgi:hypothetical protein